MGLEQQLLLRGVDLHPCFDHEIPIAQREGNGGAIVFHVVARALGPNPSRLGQPIHPLGQARGIQENAGHAPDGGIHDCFAPDGDDRAARDFALVADNVVFAAHKLPLFTLRAGGQGQRHDQHDDSDCAEEVSHGGQV